MKHKAVMKPILLRIMRMKRGLALVAIIVACISGFMAVRGTMPFMPVFGSSMEPELQAGSLILINTKVTADDVKEGDVIVYGVPAAIQDYYNYPPIVAHRVIEVRETEFGTAFRTKGDNTGEDPFTVRVQDLKGTVNRQIPYIGFPLLFLQSQQGLIFVVIALSLLAFYLYANDLSRGGQKIHRGIFAPVIEASQHGGDKLAERLETTEKGMANTQEALTGFAAAIAEYAKHLKSHTSAIQGLSEASQELKKGAVEQNKVLERIAEVMGEKRPPSEEVVTATEPAIPEVKKIKLPPGCAKSRLQRQTRGEDERIIKAG
jgi:signal peptidase I